jgi:phosphoglycerate kinase
VGDSARATVDGLADGQVALLENVRFNKGETSKDEAERGTFAEELAALADAFVSDGFGVVHRKQASVYDVAKLLPHAMGGLVAAEIDVLQRLTDQPDRPYAVVLGGSKVSDKLGVIDNLLGKADRLLIGGGMVFTFLAAQGHEVGKSLLEEDQLDTCRHYLTGADAGASRSCCPRRRGDGRSPGREPSHASYPASEIPPMIGLDIGPIRPRFAPWPTPATVSGTADGVFEFARSPAAPGRGRGADPGRRRVSVVAAATRRRRARLGFDEAAFGHISTGWRASWSPRGQGLPASPSSRGLTRGHSPYARR